jgi:Fe-S cluster assembly protein SufD
VKNAHVGSLAAALARTPELVEPYLGQIAPFEDHAFAALSTSSIEDGAFIALSNGVRLEHPIELYFVTAPASPGSGKAVLSQPRVLILAGPSTAATVIEIYAGPADPKDATTLTNAVTEVVLDDRAEIDHYRLQDEGLGAFHIGSLGVKQAAASRFATHSISLGAAMARNEVRVALEGEGAQVALRGLYLAAGTQHVDNLSLIEHMSPHCSTREAYKGILDGHARGVFSGRIRVMPGAQKTDAYQLNSNLLLSDDATVASKPQLEIFADDVKCGHGGTVGQLDEDSLFYLQSRGIDRRTAKSLLTYAFARELVGLIRPVTLRDRVEELVTARLSGSSVFREAA